MSGKISIGLLALVAIVIAIFSFYTVWLQDDIFYMFSCVPQRHTEQIGSLSDIMASQNVHYMTVNGRYVAHCLVQLFCGMLGHGWFAIFNGLLYVLFFLALFRLCWVRLDNVRGVMTVLVLGLLTFQTEMDPSCQIGFIWMLALTMFFLILFFSDNKKWNAGKIVLIGIFSLIAGNGQEALNIGVGAALLIYWAMNIQRMTVAQYVMMVCFGLGALACCLSPATINRAVDGNVISINPIIKLCRLLMYSRAIYFLVIVILWRKFKCKDSLKSLYKANSFYWHVWLALLVFNYLIGFESNRSLFGEELMAILLGVRMLPDQRLGKRWLTVLYVVLAVQYILQAQFVIKVRRIYDTVIEQYANSTDGKVYVDVDQSNYVPRWTAFSERLTFVSTDDFSMTCLNQYLQKFYPDRPAVKLIPNILKGKETEPLESGIIDLEDGCHVAILKKGERKKLYYYHSLRLPFAEVPLEESTYEFSGPDILCEGAGWTAILVSKPQYVLFDNVEFVVK